jgi:hypothetical protein
MVVYEVGVTPRSAWFKPNDGAVRGEESGDKLQATSDTLSVRNPHFHIDKGSLPANIL